MSADHPIFFEHLQPLSQSSIWRFMRSFYDRRGITAWTEGTVPSQVTNHAGIAFAYAKLIAAYVEDLVAHGTVTKDQTVYVLELGAGTGRLAYGVIVYYERLRKQLDLPRVCYVLSDFTETNVDAHRKNAAFRRFVAEGRVDFCLYDAAHPSVPQLKEARRSLSDVLKESPLCVLANYLFDTLPHDFFRVRDGRVVEGLVSLSSPDGKEPEYKHREQIEDVKLHWYFARAELPRYNEEVLDRLLDFYGELENVSVLFPAMGLRCVDSLRAMAKRGMLLVTADKAQAHVEELYGNKEPFVAHHGSFSVTANYHAMGVYAQYKGGLAWLPPPRDQPLQYCVLRFADEDVPARRLAATFDETLVHASPTDAHLLSWYIPEHQSTMGLDWYTALLRTAACDPAILVRVENLLVKLKSEPTQRQLAEISEILERSSEVYLHLRADDPYLPAALRIGLAFKLEHALAKLVGRMDDFYGIGAEVQALLDKARAAGSEQHP